MEDYSFETFQLDEALFYFDQQVNHSINVKLDRTKAPMSGLVNFAIPVRISVQNKALEWKEYFRAINRSMQVLPKIPTIPRNPKAPARKWLPRERSVFLLINILLHLTTSHFS